MTQRPNIRCEGGYLRGGQLRSTLRRHGSPELLRGRYAHRNRVRNRSEAAITPKPFAAREVGSLRRAFAVASVAARARRTRDLSLKDTVSERDFLGRRTRG